MNQTMDYFIMKNNPEAVNIKDIPVLDYGGFFDQTTALLRKKSNHVVNYFVHSASHKLRFYILIASDDQHCIFIFSHVQEKSVRLLKSIAAVSYPMHIFEREIHETLGIEFTGHPWMKPVRYPHDRFDAGQLMDTYPFYTIDSEEVHEVGVGPVHAGVIEPGHFRFICHGEKILHLEIQLGYQHRAIETLFSGKRSLLQLSVLSETIAGDTATGHALAFSQLAEALSGTVPDKILQVERIVALEMERMAVHTGDTAALCGDVGYQQGQAACEALRTMIINSTQDWCGNRFGKSLIRPGGTNYPLSVEMIDILTRNLEEIKRRFINVTDLIYGNAGILSRFENTGTVSLTQAMKSGAVGMAARTTGLNRDVRSSHPFQAYRDLHYKTALHESGDVLARGVLRKVEFELSYSVVIKLLAALRDNTGNGAPKPCRSLKFKPGMLGVSLTEGWRGEICHCAVTESDGNIALYRIKDPSVHNWMMLALAVRGEEISDFPVCNKSFNLSYCGHDL